MSSAVAEARRLAVAAVLAVHDSDRRRLCQLLEDVPAGSMPTLTEALAAITDEGVTVATRDPDAAREALAGVALDLAAELPRLTPRAARGPPRVPGQPLSATGA